MKTKKILCAALLFALLAGCGSQTEQEKLNHTETKERLETQKTEAAESGAVKISAADAKAYMDAHEADSYVLLDVRTQEEFEAGYIEGAILIPDTEVEERAPKEFPDKDKPILIYCRSGRRSALAANVLAALGYEEVYDFGGIIDWPYEVCSASAPDESTSADGEKPDPETCEHEWVEDCTSKTCTKCGAFERVAK